MSPDVIFMQILCKYIFNSMNWIVITSSSQFIRMKSPLFNLLVALCCGIAISSHVHADQVDTEAAQDSVRLNKHEKLIVLSFDGFRHDYIDKVPKIGRASCRERV